MPHGRTRCRASCQRVAGKLEVMKVNVDDARAYQRASACKVSPRCWCCAMATRSRARSARRLPTGSGGLGARRYRRPLAHSNQGSAEAAVDEVVESVGTLDFQPAIDAVEA